MSKSGYKYVLTVIAADDKPLQGDRLQKIEGILAAKQWQWLLRNKAADFLFKASPALIQLQAVRDIAGIDIFLQKLMAGGEKYPKKLLICDMDSTIIGQESLDELADFMGLRAQVEPITAAAMNGEIDFASALQQRVSLLKGMPEDVLHRCYDERITINEGAIELVQTMRASGAHTVLVSGGFTAFCERIAADVGFHEYYANRLEVIDGVLTGAVLPPILDRSAKLEILEYKMQELGIGANEVIAVGDGANDIAMLKAAGIGVAYNAKPVVAKACKYRLEHSSLEHLLWVCGLQASSHIDQEDQNMES